MASNHMSTARSTFPRVPNSSLKPELFETTHCRCLPTPLRPPSKSLALLYLRLPYNMECVTEVRDPGFTVDDLLQSPVSHRSCGLAPCLLKSRIFLHSPQFLFYLRSPLFLAWNHLFFCLPASMRIDLLFPLQPEQSIGSGKSDRIPCLQPFRARVSCLRYEAPNKC